MALAAFASIFMGNALEGGLLLGMFNMSHIGKKFNANISELPILVVDFNLTILMVIVAEEYFTSRAMIDVKELKENNPDSALVLDTNDGKLPNITDLSYQQVPVHDVQVGSYVLVGAGEVCDFNFFFAFQLNNDLEKIY